MADANMSNFLATDKVPETIFGIPVVAREEEYTEEDLEFFRAHPDAGGYYDMGDEDDAGTQGGLGAGDAAGLVQAVERTSGTEADVIGVLYGTNREDGAARAKRAALARLAAVKDPKAREQLVARLESGEIDLESIPISGPGKPLDPASVKPSRKARKTGTHRGEIRIVGAGTSTPGNHVAEAQRILENTGIMFRTDKLAGMDRDLRSAAYPRASTAVVHKPEDLPEEVLHLMTRSASQSKWADKAAADIMREMPWVTNHSTAYYVYGNRDELLDTMQRAKILLTNLYPGSDINNPAQRATAIKYLVDHDRLNYRKGDRGVQALLREYKRLEELRNAKVPMREAEKKAWEDLSSNAIWGMLVKHTPSVGGPVQAAKAGGKTRGKYPGITNNPGNVEKHERRTDKTLFDGEIGGGVRPKRFANFDDPVSGLNAAAAVLARRANGLAKEGKPFTIENYVPSYAPASENDTEGYIKNIAKYSGFARNAELDRWDADGMAKLLKTIVRFESGKPHSDWFTDDEYKTAALLLREGAFD